MWGACVACVVIFNAQHSHSQTQRKAAISQVYGAILKLRTSLLDSRRRMRISNNALLAVTINDHAAVTINGNHTELKHRLCITLNF